MNIGRCPTCHSRLDLVSMMEDESGRELLALISRLSPKMNRALLTYLTLFRPHKRDLSLSRTLTLAQDALSLTKDHDTLSVAMLETVESIRNKPTAKPMKNHRYLQQVVTSLMEQYPQQPSSIPATSTTRHESREDNNAAYRRQMKSMGIEIDASGQIIKKRVEP